MALDNEKMGASADDIIKDMNLLLAQERMGQKAIYEGLISNGTIKPNTETEFKKLYEWALSNKLIDRGRIKSWNKKQGKLPKYFTKKELVKIFDVIDRPKDGIACFIALMCGLRVREVCRLKVKDIDLESHRLFIEDSKNPHRGKEGYGTDRYVDFDQAIVGVIKKWLEIIGNTSIWFLPSDKSPDMHLRPKSLHERFRHYLKQSGLLQIDYTMTVKQKVHGRIIEKTVNRHKYYFHCLRHTMACIIYNKTSDIYAVNRFLGHKQLDTTTIYAKMTDVKMKSVISSVFGSLHYNFHNGDHLPNPKPIAQTIKSQPVVHTEANSPLQLLEMKYVNEDISEAEFLKKKQVLEATELKKVIEIRD